MSASERVRLAGTPTLVLFALALAALLALVFPTRAEYAAIVSNTGTDAYSLAYLGIVTRASPHDVGLHLVYAEKLGQAGHTQEAIAALDAILPDCARCTEVHTERLELLLTSQRAMTPGSPERDAETSRIEGELEELLRIDTNPARMRSHAALALELGEPLLAARYQSKLAMALEGDERARAYADAAVAYEQGREPARASVAYASAVEAEPDAARAIAFAKESVRAMEAANHVDRAADLARGFADKFPKQIDLLELAIRVATSANQTRSARDLGRRLLSIGQNTDARLYDQTRRELAAGDMHAASELIRRLLERHPGDPILHSAEARVAEWSGKPELALQDWLWLLDRGVQPDNKGFPEWSP